jgi:hypothetical protein
MSLEQQGEHTGEPEPATAGQFTGEVESGESPAWEEVAAGRFMPRRIRGSYKGRALG